MGPLATPRTVSVSSRVSSPPATMFLLHLLVVSADQQAGQIGVAQR